MLKPSPTERGSTAARSNRDIAFSSGHHHDFRGNCTCLRPQITSSRNSLSKLINYGEYLEWYPRSTESRYSQTFHGRVPTALSAGEATVAAIRAAATDGTKTGANRCARRYFHSSEPTTLIAKRGVCRIPRVQKI